MRTRGSLMIGCSAILLFSAHMGWAADPLEGAWRLTAYELEGDSVPVTGLMLFADGRFGAVYTMGEGSGRGHVGEYRLEEDTASFRVPFWVERVNGEAKVYQETIDASGRIEIQGDSLVIRFASGSVQELTRLPAKQDDAVSGAWSMKEYQSPARTGPADGLALFQDGHFVLVYTMNPASGGRDGRAHAGSYTLGADDLVLNVAHSLQYVSGEASVDAQPSERKTRFTVEDGALTLELGKGAIQKFEAVTP